MAQVHTLPVPYPHTLVKPDTGAWVGMKKSKQESVMIGSCGEVTGKRRTSGEKTSLEQKWLSRHQEVA